MGTKNPPLIFARRRLSTLSFSAAAYSLITMKLVVAAIMIGSAAAFAPISQPAFKLDALSAHVTGHGGSPAASAEEDLELTRAIILDYIKSEDPAEEAAAPEPEAPPSEE